MISNFSQFHELVFDFPIKTRSVIKRPTDSTTSTTSGYTSTTREQTSTTCG